MTAAFPPALPPMLVEAAVRSALAEDLGRAGDITSLATIPPGRTARAVLAARKAGVLCGMDLARAAFAAMDGRLGFDARLFDGHRLQPGETIATIEGDARALLSAERTALNYVMHLSGVASLTARFADAVAHTTARICCTRKTVPGLRALEKYAVRCGGGANHRFGLDDAILIKDNHIAVSGSVTQALHAAKTYAGHLIAIEIEVDTLDQLRERTTDRVAGYALHDLQFTARTALGGTSAPSAVLLGADGQLAGGPVNGGSAVIEFVQEIREQLAEAGVGGKQDATA